MLTNKAIQTNEAEAEPPAKKPFRLNLIASFDLFLLMVLAVFLPLISVLPVPIIRLPLGLVMVLLAPGYALVEALFVDRTDLSFPARVGLSFGLSIAINPLLALIINALPWGLRLWPMTISLGLTIFTFCSLALWRRSKSLTAANLGEVDSGLAGSQNLKIWTRLLTGLGIVVLLGLIGSGGLFLTSIFTETAQTEFYMLNSAGQALNYPRETQIGKPVELKIGMVNHQGANSHYRIEVRSGDQLISQVGSFVLQENERWEQPLVISVNKIQDSQEISIYLLYNENQTPFRQLRLWLKVTN